MLIVNTALSDPEKERRNADYTAKLARAEQDYRDGKGYTFSMEDLDLFADGQISKDQMLGRAIRRA